MSALWGDLVNWYAAYSNVVDTVGINALLALSLYIMLACGQLSLGSAGYMGVGAYTSALLSVNLNWPFPLALFAGIVVAALCALALGLPVLRLRGVYLAIATLAFVAVLQIVALNWPLTGEAEGLSAIPQETTTWMIYAALVVVCYLFWRLERSALGRAFAAIREDEDAARAMGIDATRVKLLAFVFSGAIAGLAGVLDAHLHFFISPPNYGFETAVNILTYSVVGGVGAFTGSVFGAALMTVLPEVLRFLQDYRAVFNGVVLLLVIILLPNGLLDLRRLLPRRARPALPLAPGISPLGDEAPLAVAAVPAPHALDDGAALHTLAAAPKQRVASPASPAASSRHAGAAAQWRDAAPLVAQRQGANAGGPLLQVEGVSRQFGGVHALESVSLRVEPGAIVGLIGPNGAGKTTLLNILSAFDRPSGGRVLIGGVPLAGKRVHQLTALGVARTFQSIRLFRGLSVLDNVLVGQRLAPEPGPLAQLLGLPRGRAQAAAVRAAGLDLLDAFGLTAYAGRAAGTLSYGDQRRLEIARALARRPHLLLLDEPAAGLNPQEKEQLRATLSALADGGRTVVIVEHDMGLIMSLCRHIAVLNFGRLIAEGPPSAIAADPAVIEAYLGSDD